MVDGVGEGRARRRLRDFAALVVVAPAHERPAVVAAGVGDVDLVAAERTELAFPERARSRMNRQALDVAVTVGPDFGSGVGAVHERVVGRNRTVGIDADHLAEMIREVLRGVELETLAGRNEELAFRREGETRAEVVRPRNGRLLPEDRLEAFQRRAGRVEPAAPGGCGRAALARFGVGEIDKAVLGKLGIERDIEKTALTLGIDARHAAERGRKLPVGGHYAQPSR